MTNRERQFAALGFEYAEGIELCNVITIPSTGREIRKTKNGKWETQPYNDNYWNEFDDLIEAIKFATPPKENKIRDANYTSVFDDSIVCTSRCKYDTETRRVFDIETAENAEEADNANGLTDEYVTIDGHRLSEADGVTFDY